MTDPDPTARPATPTRPHPGPGKGSWFARWIGLGVLLGFLAGAILARTTPGPALVSPTRSLLFLGVTFGLVAGLLAGVLAVLVDGARYRRRSR